LNKAKRTEIITDIRYKQSYMVVVVEEKKSLLVLIGFSKLAHLHFDGQVAPAEQLN
jgi:hypothetical protein